jgi:ABC-type Fe3+-hydroxamate transport system substrate-binding protein
MSIYTDQLGRRVEINSTVKIISVVPSQTELLYDLGLDKEVAAITKFCVHPGTWYRTKKRIGGTKQLHSEEIRLLHPDLIIANKEENVLEQIEELALEFPVWVSDINGLDSALQMIQSIGEIVSRQNAAIKIIEKIKKEFNNLELTENRPSVCYLIWKDPYMTVGGDTFINEMLDFGGYRNVFEGLNRYPVVTAKDLIAVKPDMILLSSEPYPFNEKHKQELKAIVPSAKIILADGEYFSWYGSRLAKAPAYFKQLRIKALSVL